MNSRLNTQRTVEEELRLRFGGRSRERLGSTSWEFGSKPMRVSVLLRRLGRRSSGKTGSFGSARQQRVIIKTSYSVHRRNKGRALLRAHVRYLSRDSASLDSQAGRFYDAARQGIDAKQTVRQWEADRHHFRLIVSPEQAEQLERQKEGLQGYIRQFMERMEQDLNTSLQWVAINHYNTDELHAHILLRGKRNDGRDLVLPRPYIRHQMRQSAQELATRRLGPRTLKQANEATRKQIHAQRYTSLDRLIERQVDAHQRVQLKEMGASARSSIAARLQELAKMGLATRDRLGRWQVDPQLKPKLQELGQRQHIIKNLHATLGHRAGAVIPYPSQGSPLRGRVRAVGLQDELSDQRYVLVEDEKRQLHYVRLSPSQSALVLKENQKVCVSSFAPKGKQERSARAGVGFIQVLAERGQEREA